MSALIKEHEYVCMSTDDQSLDLEIAETAMHILEINGLGRRAESICKKFNLHTFEDLGKLTLDEIESIELKEIEMMKLINLCRACFDANTYKQFRRKNLSFREHLLRVHKPTLVLTSQSIPETRECTRASLQNLLVKLVT